MFSKGDEMEITTISKLKEVKSGQSATKEEE